MQVKVERISKGKTQKGSEKTGLFDGTNWYNILGTHEVTGQTVELEKADFGKDWYEIKSVVPTQGGETIGTSNGARKLEDFVWLAHEAHKLACELEPDGQLTHDEQGQFSGTVVDRSHARAAIVNTFVIAFSNGKIAVPSSDDIPF